MAKNLDTLRQTPSVVVMIRVKECAESGGMRAVSKWLRKEARWLEVHEKELASRYRSQYFTHKKV